MVDKEGQGDELKEREIYEEEPDGKEGCDDGMYHLRNEAAHEDVPLVSEQVVAPIVDSERVGVDPVPWRGSLAGCGKV